MWQKRQENEILYDQIRETGKIVIMGDFNLPNNYGETLETLADGM